ncbi:TPA: hypothetical protein I8235_002606 [Kluyvera intermedia]|nr:hypothetical protein [Kluyvera intermedia]
MAAQAPYRGYPPVAPVSAATPGNTLQMAAQAPYPGYPPVAPVSAATPGSWHVCESFYLTVFVE